MYNKLKKYRLLLLYSVLVLYSFIILLLPSIIPNDVILKNPVDKFLHFIAYGILSFLLYFVLYFQNSISLLKKYPAVSTILFVAIFGFFDEFRQHYMLSRTANILDWYANLLGSLFSIILIESTIYLVKKLNNL